MINPYFNHQTEASEQNLVNDLIVESIQMFGMDVQYLPYVPGAPDSLFGEDATSSFNKAFVIEMYFENVAGFEGEKNFFSMFGLESRKSATLIVADSRFKEVVKNQEGFASLPVQQQTDAYVRPMEHDLIRIPLTGDIFEIKFVDHESVFYQVGKNYIWRLSVEKYRASNESINTTVQEIDDLAAALLNSNSVANVPLADNQQLDTEAAINLDTTEDDIFSEGNL